MGKGPAYAPVAKHPNPSLNADDALARLFKTVEEKGEKERKENEDRKIQTQHLWYREDNNDSDSGQG